MGGGLRREGADVEEGDRRRGGGTSKRGIVVEGDVVEGDVEEGEERRRWESSKRGDVEDWGDVEDGRGGGLEDEYIPDNNVYTVL